MYTCGFFSLLEKIFSSAANRSDLAAATSTVWATLLEPDDVGAVPVSQERPAPERSRSHRSATLSSRQLAEEERRRANCAGVVSEPYAEIAERRERAPRADGLLVQLTERGPFSVRGSGRTETRTGNGPGTGWERTGAPHLDFTCFPP